MSLARTILITALDSRSHRSRGTCVPAVAHRQLERPSAPLVAIERVLHAHVATATQATATPSPLLPSCFAPNSTPRAAAPFNSTFARRTTSPTPSPARSRRANAYWLVVFVLLTELHAHGYIRRIERHERESYQLARIAYELAEKQLCLTYDGQSASTDGVAA